MKSIVFATLATIGALSSPLAVRGVPSPQATDPAMSSGYSNVIDRPDSVIAVTQVFGDGIKLTGVALRYPQIMTASELGDASFSVTGRTVVSVSLSDHIDMGQGGDEGRYVIIHLSPDDKDASLKAGFSGGPRPGRGMKPKSLSPSDANGIPPIPIEKHPFKKASAEVILPDGTTVATQGQVNLIVDRFRQQIYTDPVTGQVLNYNIFVPDNIAELGKVPMVLFMEDASCVGPYVQTPLMQGLGAVVWASPEDQAERPCIVVGAHLHMDEQTPHLHVTVVPIVTTERKRKASEAKATKRYRTKPKNGPRLSADDIMTRENLTSFQDTYAKAMERFGLERGVRGSEARHVDQHEYYRDCQRKKKDLEHDVSQLSIEKSALSIENRSLKAAKEKAERETKALEGKKILIEGYNSKMLQENAQLIDANERLQSENESLSGSNSSLAAQNRELTEEKERVSGELAVIESDRKKLTAEKKGL